MWDKRWSDYVGSFRDRGAPSLCEDTLLSIVFDGDYADPVLLLSHTHPPTGRYSDGQLRLLLRTPR